MIRATYGRALLDYLQCHPNEWVSALELFERGGIRFGERIHELRKKGFQIDNKIETNANGIKHSWYRLVLFQ